MMLKIKKCLLNTLKLNLIYLFIIFLISTITIIFISFDHKIESSYKYKNTNHTEINSNHISLNENPIKINSIKTTFPDKDGAVNLIINWTNLSNKAISKISFTILPTNDIGTPLKCFKYGRSKYTITDTIYSYYNLGNIQYSSIFAKVWYNSGITNAKLTQIRIEYTDKHIKIIKYVM